MSSLFQASERSHAGLILMTELAFGYGQTNAAQTLQEVASNKLLSQGYLEEIASALKKAGLIEGKKGPGGGYVLTRAPELITTEAILTALEGPVRLVECQQALKTCPAEHACSTRPFWNVLQQRLIETLRETTLADLLKR
ncbi:Rrf2 family transcriptional regulator [Patescibacteria group bacterium]|nr:Rrf2 family transcriptional regulator [Patescibacteria group bacterium]